MSHDNCGQPSDRYHFSDYSDTILTLKNPNQRFAPWNKSHADFPPPQLGENVDMETADIVEDAAELTDDNDGDDEYNPSVLFHVDSQCLIRSSRVFKATLTGPWTESSLEPTTIQGHKYNLTAHGFDPEALTIVFDVLHYCTSRVPASISLEILCKIAVIVDYYALHEAVHFFARSWLTAPLDDKPPTKYGRDAIMWLCIVSVWRLETGIQLSTAVIVRECNEEIRTLGLPISDTAVDAANLRRKKIIIKLFQVLETTMRDLLENHAGCSFDCRSLLLGALNKHLHDQGLLRRVLGLDPNTWPFEGLSASDLVKKIDQIPSTPQCEGILRCTLGGLLKPKLSAAVSESGLLGIQLDTDAANQIGGGIVEKKKKKKKTGLW